MSGGAVFNSWGQLCGLECSGVLGEDVVSLLWPGAIMPFRTPYLALTNLLTEGKAGRLLVEGWERVQGTPTEARWE
ncbi:MAG: hypothetical protein JWM76_4412 [Pseudonocardiales bacterium]|nr:hypothetical protein [Pseudonocardiales bacterium]